MTPRRGLLAGLAAAYDAWKLSSAGRAEPVVDGFTGDQQFFMSYAQSWRAKYREPALRQQVITDGHAPDEYRSDTIRNLDAWYEAFGVKEKMPVQLEALADEIVEWNERSIADAIRRQARHEDTTRWDTIDFKLD